MKARPRKYGYEGACKSTRSVQIILFSLFSVVLTLNCGSERITGPKEVLNWKVYTTADGLSHNAISDIAIDKQDRIWVATLWTINVFDGVKWDTIDASDGLPYENARVLHFDHQGNLWIGSGGNGNGLVKYDGTKFTLFTTADGLSDNRILSIGSQSDGTIWVGTVFGGVCRFDGTQWQCFNDTTYLGSSEVWSTFVENDSSIWFGNQDGVSRYDGKTWIKYLGFYSDTFPNGWHYPKDVYSIGFDHQGRGWFGFSRGVYEYSNGEFHLTILDNYNNVTISDIAADSKGKVWFSSFTRGAYCFDAGVWTNYSLADGMPSTWASSVAVDSKGNIWFGTEEGLVKLQVTQ